MAAWQLGRLGESAVRLCFAAGAAVLVLASLWWALLRWRLWAGGAVESGLPAVVLHAVLMSLCFFPLFFAGFMATTGLQWLGSPSVPARRLWPGVGLAFIGVLALLAAWAGPAAWAAPLAGLALTALALAWSGWLLIFARLWLGAAERGHAAGLLASALLGGLALWWAVGAAWAGEWDLLLGIARAAVWGFVGTTFLAAGHRMVPFLSGSPSRRWHAGGLLPLAVLLALGVQALAALGLNLDPWGARLNLVTGGALLVLALAWALVQSLRPKLLAMLFAGFAWLGLALLLAGLGSGTLGLHAFAMGFMGSTMLAMLSRFAALQVGVHVVVDALLWRLFLILQVAIVCRLVGAGSMALLALAATLWAGVWLTWGLRYGRWMGVSKGEVRGS